MIPHDIADLFSQSTKGKFRLLEPMKNHTSFKVGGPCDLFFQPEGLEDLKKGLELANKHNIPYFILGGGNNILVADEGISGIAIKLGNSFAKFEFHKDTVLAGAALSNSVFLQKAVEKEIEGFEFLAGIPGTLGGALIMNAGTYLGDMAKVIKEATFFTKDCEFKTLKKDEMGLTYRNSNIPRNWIVLELIFTAVSGKREEIVEKIRQLKKRRNESQPLTYPNAGSIFKNPSVGDHAWKLIDSVGGRGLRVGDAEVAEKHANFIINLNNAKAADVAALMEELIDRVEKKHGIRLEPEVKLVGRWPEL